MTTPYIPAFELWNTKDEEIKFYALLGVLVSMHAGLDSANFEFFAKATGMDRESAASRYYANSRESARAEMTNKAMQSLLAADTSKLGKWNQLAGEMKVSISNPTPTSYRHLVSHNAAEAQQTIPPLDLPDLPPDLPASLGRRVGGDPSKSDAERFSVETKHQVSQNLLKAKHAKNRPQIDAGTPELMDACRRLSVLYAGLEELFASL